MRIATFNCNSIRVRLPAILSWLDSHAPDILALQETKVVDKDFPAQAIRDHGWHVCYRGEKTYNGVALISREEPESFAFGLDDEDEGVSGPRLARARVGGVDIVNTYVPQGQSLDSDKFQFKLHWLSRLRKFFDRHYRPADKLVWVGDINVAPTPIDVYDSKAVWPHVCHCQPVIDAMAAVVDFGFVDVFRKHLPEPETFTFWDYRQRDAYSRNRGWRIDHILATKPLADASVACHVDKDARGRERPSDHTFVYADFTL